MSTTGPCTGTENIEKPFESYISLRNVSSLHRPVPDDNALENEEGEWPCLRAMSRLYILLPAP